MDKHVQQKVFSVVCPKCSTAFRTASYSVFQVEVPMMHPVLREVVLQNLVITATPCPECNCGTPIEEHTPYKWEKYEE